MRVDRDLLYKAVCAGLQNEDGRARGSYLTVYDNLTHDEIKPLLPAIRRAVVEPAPSGIMFADNIRMGGLPILLKHRVPEGIRPPLTPRRPVAALDEKGNLIQSSRPPSSPPPHPPTPHGNRT